MKYMTIEQVHEKQLVIWLTFGFHSSINKTDLKIQSNQKVKQKGS